MDHCLGNDIDPKDQEQGRDQRDMISYVVHFIDKLSDFVHVREKDRYSLNTIHYIPGSRFQKPLQGKNLNLGQIFPTFESSTMSENAGKIGLDKEKSYETERPRENHPLQ